MHWILASLLMFLSSVIVYLLIRKGQIEKIPNTVNNFYIFFIPAIIFFFIVLFTNVSFIVPISQFVIIFLTAFFLSYLGNVASLRSLKAAPNPGYSLILSKSYVVYTTIVSVILFNSEITITSVFAILLIIGFSSLIVISKPHNGKKPNREWIVFAFCSFFAWGTLALVSKYLFNQDLNVFLYLFYLHIFVSCFIFIESKIRQITLLPKRTTVLLLLVIGTANMFFNMFLQYGIKVAPNPGYINAVNASSIAAVTLCSAYFFKDELTKQKLIGILGVTVGLILLFL